MNRLALLKLIAICGCLIHFGGCSSLQTKVNPAEEYTTDSGFKFRFPMSGDWFPGPAQNGMFLVGQKPSEDGSSKVAIVRHGPIHTPGGKPMSTKAMLEAFLRDIEAEAKAGRVTNVKNRFDQKKYQGAEVRELRTKWRGQHPQRSHEHDQRGHDLPSSAKARTIHLDGYQ